MSAHTPLDFSDEVLSLLSGLPVPSRIAVCGHARPDGDAVGSTLALSLALTAQGHTVYPLTADAAEPPATYAWLDGFEMLHSVAAVSVGDPVDLFISLDNPNPKRLALAAPMCEAASIRLVVDHHPDTEGYADLYAVHTAAGSTSHVVWDLLGRLGWERTAAIATACYAGLSSDTGSFRYSNTSERVFAAAAEMVAAGASPSHVSRYLYESKSPARIALETRVMERLALANGGIVVTAWVEERDYEETGATHPDGENLSDLVRVVDSADIAVLVTHGGPRGPRVSLRSKTDFDVSAIAARFGGGGHRAAAGISWPRLDDSVSDILDTLLPLLPGGESSHGEA